VGTIRRLLMKRRLITVGAISIMVIAFCAAKAGANIVSSTVLRPPRTESLGRSVDRSSLLLRVGQSMVGFQRRSDGHHREGLVVRHGAASDTARSQSALALRPVASGLPSHYLQQRRSSQAPNRSDAPACASSPTWPS
jgi:hypothetical protein